MIVFQKGTYNSTNPIISYCINEDLLLFEDKCIYFLDGNNGIGKTTFIEQIVLPLSKNSKFPVFFLGQDYELQLYFMCSITKFPVNRALENPSELLELLLYKHGYIKTIILDEFDKRCEIESLNKILDKHNISSIFVITHIPSNQRQRYFFNIFKKGFVLHMNNNTSDVCSNKLVTISCEILWQ